MTRDLRAAPGSTCPRCAATVKPDARWCGQCYLPAAECAPPPAAPPQPPAGVTAGWPCGACGALTDFGLADCRGCGAAFLAGLVDRTPTIVLPGLGDLGAMSKGRLLALSALAAVLLAVVGVLGMLALGSVL